MATLAWSFENTFDLAITELVIYVNSMTTVDPGFIQWKIETNSYCAVLEDKNSNVVKLETPEGENFHKFITLKLEIDPTKVDKFFSSSVEESQIQMKIKFKPECENLQSIKMIKWSPSLVNESNLSCVEKPQVSRNIFSRLNCSSTDPKLPPRCRLIIAIDETDGFSTGPNGSIQPKLRQAVNNLVENLWTKFHDKIFDQFGLVVVRFGGKNGTPFSSEKLKGDEGPFRNQKIDPTYGKGSLAYRDGTSIYEFAPFPDAKSTEFMFKKYLEMKIPEISEETSPLLQKGLNDSSRDVMDKLPVGNLAFMQASGAFEDMIEMMPEGYDLFVSSQFRPESRTFLYSLYNRVKFSFREMRKNWVERTTTFTRA